MEPDKLHQSQASWQTHSHVVLFYRYFLPSDKVNEDKDVASSGGVLNTSTLQFFQTHSNHYLTLLQAHQTRLCAKLGMKGRILLSTEGINGTLSCHEDELKQYRQEMETFDLLSEFDPPFIVEEDAPQKGRGRLFTNIDWKISIVQYKDGEENQREPFPDLKIQIVKEIVNTGGVIDAKDIPSQSGKEISPEEFHNILMDAKDDSDTSMKKNEVVLIDVRNTFEHAIGHFVHPHSNTIIPETESGGSTTSISTINEISKSSALKQKSSPTPAINPNTVTFSHFDSNFCSKYSDILKDKKVLMYCTGGIRCVKASAMLKKRGVEDVSHLSGGIHRYLEKYSSDGFFKGKCMVFDQRVALDPESLKSGCKSEETPKTDNNNTPPIVGKCIECTIPYDKLSGGNLCTVCRDLVLICPSCRESKHEYHCDRHRKWKNAYFTFLDGFTIEELQEQSAELQKLHDLYIPPKEHKNVRRTLRKQLEKVLDRVCKLKEGSADVESNPRRRCRTCFELDDVCDGLCWGFWKHSQMHLSSELLEPIREIKIGQRVQPGPHWNEFRLGTKYTEFSSVSKKSKSDSQAMNTLEGPRLKTGIVVQIKAWSSGATENDCVAVLWDSSPPVSCSRRKRRKQQVTPEDAAENDLRQAAIYRWGTVARNGKRMYDVDLA